MPNLILQTKFNPARITIITGVERLRESTVEKINAIVPLLTTTTPTRSKTTPSLELNLNPMRHYTMDLPSHYCDHQSRCFIYLHLIEILESEDWKLRASSGSNDPSACPLVEPR